MSLQFSLDGRDSRSLGDISSGSEVGALSSHQDSQQRPPPTVNLGGYSDTSIDAISLYNLPLTEYMRPIVHVTARPSVATDTLVLGSQPRRQESESSGTTGSPSIPTSFRQDSFDSIEELLLAIADMGFEQPRDLILYGESEEDDDWVDVVGFQVLEAATRLLSQDQNLTDDADSEEDRHIAIKRTCRQVYTITKLQGGLRSFTKHFPGLVSNPSIDGLILPAYVARANIYLGSASSANETVLEALNVHAIVNCGAIEALSAKLVRQFQYIYIPIVDSMSQSLEPYLTTVLAFLEATLSQGRPVFVHCSQGVSRSVSCVIARLVTAHGMTLDDAITEVRSARQCARPNENFLDQLRTAYHSP
jgi:protein-tyrosine phosphatase